MLYGMNAVICNYFSYNDLKEKCWTTLLFNTLLFCATISTLRVNRYPMFHQPLSLRFHNVLYFLIRIRTCSCWWWWRLTPSSTSWITLRLLSLLRLRSTWLLVTWRTRRRNTISRISTISTSYTTTSSTSILTSRVFWN